MTFLPQEEPPVHCQHARECPGCPSMGVARSEQRSRKRTQVRDAFARFPAIEEQAIDEVPEARPAIGYRTRAKLMVGGRVREAAPRLGLYREGTHDVVDVPSCLVLTEALAEAAARMRSLLLAPPTDAGGALVPSDDGGALEAVDLREVRDGQARVMLTLVLNRERQPSSMAVKAAVDAVRKACPDVASIAINLRGSGPQVLGAETFVAWGKGEHPDRLDESSPFTIATHGSFVQAHRGTATAIHDEIVRELRELEVARGTLRVIELFAGSGALALRLAASGISVHAVEAFGPSIELARRAADLQRIEGLSIEVADAGEAIAKRLADRAHAIIVDPPRRGLSAELRSQVARLDPERVIYVSCDPETLARDLAHFARLGFSSRRVAPFDLMPMTAHVETLAVLTRAPTPALRVVYEDASMVVIDKDPHEPLGSNDPRVVSTLSRLRMVAGAEHAVPIRSLEPEVSGLVVFARSAEHVDSVEKRFAGATISELALVRGITHRKGTIRRKLRARGQAIEASTRFARRAVWGGHSFLSVTVDPGVLHQARRHLASIGHGVLGDSQYGHVPSNRHLWERAALDRPFLHRERIEWMPGEAGSPHIFEAPLAPDLALVRDRVNGR